MDFSPQKVIVSPFQMKEVELISFDAEGTLVTPGFSEAIWHEAIPDLYARKEGMEPSQARKLVYSQYDMVGEQRLEWYDIDYWFDRLGLGSSDQAIQSCLPSIEYYPEVLEVLSALGRQYRLIVASCTPRELLAHLLQDIEGHFVRVFSSVTHYRQLKNPGFFLRVCQEMEVEPSRVVHVGDSWQMDYVSSREAGICGYYLDRSEAAGPESLTDLTELQRLLM